MKVYRAVLLSLLMVAPLFASVAPNYLGLRQKDFEDVFGTETRATWTADGKVLLSLVGRSTAFVGARGSPDAVLNPLQPYVGALEGVVLRVNSPRTVVTRESTHYEFSQMIGEQ